MSKTGREGEIEALTVLARRFTDREMYPEAAELFQLTLRLDPGNRGAKLALAEVRRMQRQYKGTELKSLQEVLREQFRRDAIDAAHFLGLAQLYAEKGENARAAECLEIARAKDPANPLHYRLQGRILLRRRNFDQASRELRRALRYNPFDREVAESLGRVEYERKSFREALEATIHAFLLLNEGDSEGAFRLKRRIRTLKQILGLDNQELVHLFHEAQDRLHLAFDRLEWHRERFMEEGGLLDGIALAGAPPRSKRGGLIELAARLRQLGVWAELTDEQIFQLTAVIHEEFHERDSLIFAGGTQGGDLYIVERGEVSIRRSTPYGNFTLDTLPAGTLFGEVNFVSRFQRSGDAVASQPSVLLRIDAEGLQRLVESSPDLGARLYWIFWHALARKLRATNEQLKDFFAPEARPENFVRLRHQARTATGPVEVARDDKIRLFREQGLSRDELMTLATFSREKRFSGGGMIFEEGDEGQEMYIVLEGRVLISKSIPGAGQEALAILGRGDFFGEMSLIDGEPRSADARAHGGPVTVLALSEETVQNVLSMDSEASMEFLHLLCRLIAQRLREIDEKVVGWRIIAGHEGEEAPPVPRGAESRSA